MGTELKGRKGGQSLRGERGTEPKGGKGAEPIWGGGQKHEGARHITGNVLILFRNF